MSVLNVFTKHKIHLEMFEAVCSIHSKWCISIVRSNYGGTCGVMFIVVGNEHGDTSSNPRRNWLYFT